MVRKMMILNTILQFYSTEVLLEHLFIIAAMIAALSSTHVLSGLFWCFSYRESLLDLQITGIHFHFSLHHL